MYWFMNMLILSPVRIGEAGYNAKHGPNTSESSVVTSADDWHLSGLFLAIVETSSGFRSSCYWTDRNRANAENIRIGLVFVVLAQWKFLYYIDRFDNIKANKSRLINNILYFLWLYDEFFIILFNILKIVELDCCQIIILSICVPSTHA